MTEASVIGSGTTVRGHVRGEGALTVAGRVEGNIEMSGEITLAPGSAVKGNVTGSDVRAAGDIAGDIVATATVVIEGEARVLGDVRSPSIGILEGARVRGSVQSNGASGMDTQEVAAALSEEPVSTARTAPVARSGPRISASPAARPATARIAPPRGPVIPARKKAAKTQTATASTRGAAKKRPPAPVVPAVRKGSKATKRRRTTS